MNRGRWLVLIGCAAVVLAAWALAVPFRETATLPTCLTVDGVSGTGRPQVFECPVRETFMACGAPIGGPEPDTDPCARGNRLRTRGLLVGEAGFALAAAFVIIASRRGLSAEPPTMGPEVDAPLP